MARAEIESTTIVLRGQFNPAIFHPAWFVDQELLAPNEGEAAKLQVVHPEIAAFQTEWFELHVQRDRFLASTSLAPYYELLRDLVRDVFARLRHTPLTALGINGGFHFHLDSAESWHGIGNRLAPKQDWQDILSKPGLRSLVIEGQRDDSYEGYIQVKVEPSRRIETGVFVEVNDHYQLSSHPAGPVGGLTDILDTQWQLSRSRCLEITEKVVNLG